MGNNDFDFDFDELNIQLSMDSINDAIEEMAETKPEAALYFTLGRTVGRMDITTILMKIIKNEAKQAEALKELLKRKRG